MLNFRKFRACAASAAIALVLGLSSATSWAADVVYNNFGPGDTYSNAGVWVGHRTAIPDWAIGATSFTPSQSGFLSRLTLGAHKISGPSSDLLLTLRADNNTAPTGPDLWSQTFPSVLPTSWGSTVALNTANGPWLDAGTRYWLVVNMPDQLTYSAWDSGLVGTSPDAIFSSVNGQWQVYKTSVGYSLRVDVVPEPSTLALLAAPMLLTLRRRRPQRNA